ncbi:MAG: sce7726 family protein [Armatimonadota bacterium]
MNFDQQSYQQNCKRQHFLLTNDKMIRSSLLYELDKRCGGDPNTKIIEELGIKHGEARIDIAVVNGIIHGYELKSERDTLNRLPEQIKTYNAVLDQVTLVVGKNHLYEAIKIVPEWWGITLAKADNQKGSVIFYTIRLADLNPEQNNTAIAALLWRDEALHILEEIGKADGVRSKNRQVIYERLAQVLDQDILRQKVRQQLRTRVNWRSGLQCMPSGG